MSRTPRIGTWGSCIGTGGTVEASEESLGKSWVVLGGAGEDPMPVLVLLQEACTPEILVDQGRREHRLHCLAGLALARRNGPQSVAEWTAK